VKGIPRRSSVILAPAVILFVVLAAFAMIPSTTVVVDGQGGTPPTFNITLLKVLNISFSNDKPKEGQNVTIIVLIANNDTVDATNVSLTIRYDTTNITTVPHLTISAGKVLKVEVPWKAVKFTHTIYAIPSYERNVLTTASNRADIVVAAKPIGNAYVVFAALVIVLLAFLAAVAAPSVWEHVRKR